jgi:E3 ubiquitin-protein ligase RNF14
MIDVELDDERAEELTTLESIYPELVRHVDNPYAATLEILVAPSIPLPITFEPGQDVERLAYLPPLRLEIELPAAYPAEAPPKLRLSASWLPKSIQATLTGEARSLWEEYDGMPILFTYVSSIQEKTEAAFGLEELTLPACMRKELVNYSRRMKKELFDKETFDCGVCLEPKKGSACYRMARCSHVFCVSCLQDYYNSCITEGEVNNIKCMSTDCGKLAGRKSKKKERLLSPKELLQIPIARDQVERYAKIKRKKKIESDPSIVFCPRTWCQGAMRTDKYPKITDVGQMDDSDSETEEEGKAQQDGTTNTDSGPQKRGIGTRGMERLQVCEDCNLAFCVVCLASWHGDFVRCEPRDATQLTEDDQASLNFIMKNTSPCPYCSVPCQKSCKFIPILSRVAIVGYKAPPVLNGSLSRQSFLTALIAVLSNFSLRRPPRSYIALLLQRESRHSTNNLLTIMTVGCNHMTCAQCKTHFCYLCAAWLNPDHPYQHFNDPKNKACFQRLMDGAEGDMANGVVQFAGRRGAEQMANFWEQEAIRLQMEEIELDERTR